MASPTSWRGMSKTRKTIALGVLLLIVVAGIAVELPRYVKGTPFKNPEQFVAETDFGYYLSNPQKESPVGVASYGIYNNSGSLQTYSINSSEVVGKANISSIAALTTWDYGGVDYSPSFSSLACVDCASLQMNVNAIVQTSEGEQVFWIQNALPFANTATHQVLLPIGIVWNLTTANADITPYAIGTGSPSPLGPLNNIVYGFGSFLGPQTSYTLPLTVKMITSISSSTKGVNVSLSDVPFGNGTLAGGDYTFGRVYIPISNVISASIVVTTSAYPWRYNPGAYPTFNSELVWTGYCCAQTTEFTEMNSNLSLLYLNSNGRLGPYPSVYSFGDVVETANNLRVIPTQTGGHVVTGENNNTYLGS